MRFHRQAVHPLLAEAEEPEDPGSSCGSNREVELRAMPSEKSMLARDTRRCWWIGGLEQPTPSAAMIQKIAIAPLTGRLWGCPNQKSPKQLILNMFLMRLRASMY